MMTSDQLRNAYIAFFQKKSHREISGKSLFPENDPSVLFTTAGMHPLVSYLSGEEHPAGKRLVNCQACIRTGDIDAVGDRTHLTFFEMLGNWSLGDYFKEEALACSFEFLTSSQYLDLDPSRIHVTVFAGEAKTAHSMEIPCDQESMFIWKNLGIPEERVHLLSRKDNWWGPAGLTGPCGPDSEIFYDTNRASCGDSCIPGQCSCGKYIEIWNNVFMQYYKEEDGSFRDLGRPCVDTGMGLERTVAILNKKESVFETDIFSGIIERIVEIAQCYSTAIGYTHGDGLKDRSVRIIADHIRASVMILGDPLAIVPSNLGQGYILRRLLRRAICYAKNLGIGKPFLSSIVDPVIESLGERYPYLSEVRSFIVQEIDLEEKRFMQTLFKGKQELQNMLDRFSLKSESAEENRRVLSGNLAFKLYDTYGYPVELTKEIIAEHGMEVDMAGFAEAFAKHREASKKGLDKVFKGGLGDHSQMTTAYHTATHLLHSALRQILGEHVAQRGSNITADRMRFDFVHPQALSKAEIKEVEDLVNQQICQNHPIHVQTMNLVEAKAKGALVLFSAKYDEEVKVYRMGDFSCEVCGGPHVENTGELGKFQIVKEQSSSQGIRRIKAVLEGTGQ